MTRRRIGHWIIGAAALLAFAVLPGCVSEKTDATGSYHDGRNYTDALYSTMFQRAFQYEGPARNPVIVIHGLLGSRLDDLDRNENIWGVFSLREMMNGGKFARLAHPMGMDQPLAELRNRVISTGLLETSAIRVMGLEFHLDNYDILVQTLTDSGYVPDNAKLPEGKNFYSQFIYYYDWRRDISENAVGLQKFIEEKRAYLNKKYRELYGERDYEIRFDLVSHSMGGLLARYYLRYGGTPLPENESDTLPVTWKGSEDVDKVLIIGTPNAGYVDTLLELTNGLRLIPRAPMYPKTVIGTFPSYYQMLPNREGKQVLWAGTGDEVDYMNPDVWSQFQWGLADPRQDDWLKVLLPDVKTRDERYSIAVDHLKKCLKRARQFKKAMQIRAEDYPDNVAVFLIAGDAVPTNHTLAADRLTGELSVIRQESGDGKITAASTLLDLRDGGDWLLHTDSPIKWDGVYYFQGGHMGIMNSQVFASNLRFLLLGLPTERQRKQHLSPDQYRSR